LKTETITIENIGEVTFREISNKDIKKIFGMIEQAKSVPATQFFAEKTDELLSMCSDISVAMLEEMYPSDVKSCFDAFMKANDTVATLLYSIGMDKIFNKVSHFVAENFTKTFMENYKQTFPEA